MIGIMIGFGFFALLFLVTAFVGLVATAGSPIFYGVAAIGLLFGLVTVVLSFGTSSG